MKFEHQITIDATCAAVWAVLSDFPKAASLIPDVSDIQQLEDGSYQGAMRVRVGPIGLNINGTIEVEQDESRGRWNMRASGQDRRVGGGRCESIDLPHAYGETFGYRCTG